jgi:hypothetical protein
MQSFSDFIDKNFKFGHKVTTIHKSSAGVKIENSATPSGGNFKSYTKVNFPAANGKAEFQITANGPAEDTKAKFEFGRLVENLDLSLTATAEPNVTLEAGFKPISNVGTKFELISDLADKRSLKASVNASSNGVKATVDTEVCLSGGGLKDYNVKVDYSQKSLLATAKTSKGRSVFTAGVAQQWCTGFYFGAQVKHTVKDASTEVTIGSKHCLKGDTTISQMVDINGVLSCAIEQKLANPALKVNAAAQFNLLGSNCFVAEKFGLGLTFGDF